MGSIIKVRTISAATETAIQVSNSKFARAMAIGTNWTSARFGLRLHIDTTLANLPGTPVFFFGFCSGTSAIFGDASTTHAVGVGSDATWTYFTTGGSGNVYFNAALLKPFKRVSTTISKGTSFGQSSMPNPSTAANRMCWFVDVTKGSPNFSFRIFTPTTGTTSDVSQAVFLQQMEATTPSLVNHSYFSAQTLAVSESTDGFLDSVNVSWDQTTPSIEICDIAVARLS